MISERDVPSEATLSEEVLQGLFKTSPISLVVTDRTGTIANVNDRVGELLGVSPGTILGRNVFDKSWEPWDADGDPLPLEDHPFARMLNGTATDDEELSIRLPNGSRVRFRISGAPIHDSDGAIIAAVATLEDRTLTSMREQELKEKNRQLESFASVLSHHLRNPLAIACGYLSLARETGDDTHLDRVSEAHDRITELIDSLLVLARRGEMIIDLEPVSLATAAQAAWADVETGTASLTVSPGLHVVHADRRRVQQLFGNLFRNSAEHGGDVVNVAVAPLSDERGFTVTDDGNGLAGVVGRIRLDDYLEEIEEVNGLGLNLVQALSDSHGWQVFVSPRPGGGVCFEFVVGG